MGRYNNKVKREWLNKLAESGKTPTEFYRDVQGSPSASTLLKWVNKEPTKKKKNHIEITINGLKVSGAREDVIDLLVSVHAK